MAKKIKTTLGGDRLGSGNRNKLEMHNYYRSNHNLSCSRISSMAPGVLYPMYTNIGLTGDTWDIDLNAFVRTLPTEGPLFGAFKLQVDVFTADMRLYQAILHNNTTEIGFDMDQVLMPKIELSAYVKYNSNKNRFEEQHSRTSLVNYIGLSGVGSLQGTTTGKVTRKFNALPILAYYDIFKNYYANKQEENAYVITKNNVTINQIVTPTLYNKSGEFINFTNISTENNKTTFDYSEIKGGSVLILESDTGLYPKQMGVSIGSINLSVQEIYELNTNGLDEGVFTFTQYTNNKIVIRINTNTASASFYYNRSFTGYSNNIMLKSFNLKNIDNMRKNLLTLWDLGEEYIIEEENAEYPYKALVDYNGTDNKSLNAYPMNGLVVKCYQSDWFNNWLDNEYVAKISEKSNVNVTNGSFSIDALNFAKKLYDHYNRIAVTGGSYDDWQKAAYGMVHYGKAEKPIYHGGMSSEVIFDEVISSAQTTSDNGEVNPLGTLGGRGALKSRKGGHVIVKCNEECVIMVMVSLTPRTTQTQGNAWYMTELDSINDLHQPDFDRIGFQDLLVEQMAWWDAKYISTQGLWSRTSAGKQPAWMQYTTDVNKAFGDMADEDGYGFMILNRNYSVDSANGRVADVTTYIDPSKFNYAFAVKDITAQNFWTFFNLDIIVRRLMSAKQMPNV